MSMLTDTLFETDTSQPVITEGLSHSDLMTLSAVEGWLKLGSPEDALHELDDIRPTARGHSIVLMARAHVYASMGWRETALALVRVICEAEPYFPAAWLCHANVLREVRGLSAARDLLQSVVVKFPREPLVPYQLACFHAQLGETGPAAHWLLKAFEVDGTVELKLKSIQDPDLDPLWKKILESMDSFEAAGLTKLAALAKYPVA